MPLFTRVWRRRIESKLIMLALPNRPGVAKHVSSLVPSPEMPEHVYSRA